MPNEIYQTTHFGNCSTTGFGSIYYQYINK